MEIDQVATSRMTLPGEEIKALVEGDHGNAFEVLGPHVVDTGRGPALVVRAFLPDADTVRVVPSDGPHEPRIMERVHPAGLFEALFPDQRETFRYRLEVADGRGGTAEIGVTPKGYAAAHRARRVRDERSRTETVTEAIYGAGFNSNGRFYATSSEELGMTPTNFRSGGRGALIRFAVGECSLGSILVATTDKGVCAILLGDDPGALVRDLQDRFPRAELIGGDREFERTVARVVGFVEEPAIGLDLPLDVRGTAFQRRVWQALRDIPAGATATYTEIAVRIGSSHAVRAVAHACASNAIAVAIPCHRVVRVGGALAGYRWGIERKRALLAREAAS